MRELIERYLKDLVAQGRAELTVSAYRSDLRGFSRHLEKAGLSLPDLALRDLRAYQRYLADHLRPASVHRKFHALRGFLRWCVGEGEIPADPSRGLVLGRIPDREPLAVTEEEVERALHAARYDLPALAALSLLAYTGGRRAELFRITWQDVDFERRLLRLYGKGGRIRYVPLVRPVIEVLLALRGKEWARPEDPVLVNRFGQRLSRDGIRKIVLRYTKEAGIERHITPHSFRHGVATRLARQGLDPFAIAAIMGHRSIETTQQYVHPGMTQRREALEQLAAGPADRGAGGVRRRIVQQSPQAALLAGLTALGEGRDFGVEAGFYAVLKAFALALLRQESPHEQQCTERPEGL